MSTPGTYFQINAECEAMAARAFLLLMSDEIQSISGPLASELFDMVSDTNEAEAKAVIASYEATL